MGYVTPQAVAATVCSSQTVPEKEPKVTVFNNNAISNIVTFLKLSALYIVRQLNIMLVPSP